MEGVFLLGCYSTHEARGLIWVTCDAGVCGSALRGWGAESQAHGFIFSGSSPLRAVPNEVSGPVRGSLTVQCHYEPGWETHKKWWCRDAGGKMCDSITKTNGLEREVKGDRVSIKDNWKLHMFTVTMEDLRWNDADTYGCGIERNEALLGVAVKVTIDPGKSMYVDVDVSLQGLFCPGP